MAALSKRADCVNLSFAPFIATPPPDCPGWLGQAWSVGARAPNADKLEA
jgi:hypothetical protein